VDLRFILAVIRINADLERVGDHATNIAEDVIFWVRGADVRHGALMNEESPADDKAPTP
jgi:phosphate transport system protein